MARYKTVVYIVCGVIAFFAARLFAHPARIALFSFMTVLGMAFLVRPIEAARICRISPRISAGKLRASGLVFIAYAMIGAMAIRFDWSHTHPSWKGVRLVAGLFVAIVVAGIAMAHAEESRFK